MNYADWNMDEQLGSSISDEQEEPFSFNSAISFFQKLFTFDQNEQFSVHCPYCQKVIVICSIL